MNIQSSVNSLLNTGAYLKRMGQMAKPSSSIQQQNVNVVLPNYVEEYAKMAIERMQSQQQAQKNQRDNFKNYRSSTKKNIIEAIQRVENEKRGAK